MVTVTYKANLVNPENISKHFVYSKTVDNNENVELLFEKSNDVKYAEKLFLEPLSWRDTWTMCIAAKNVSEDNHMPAKFVWNIGVYSLWGKYKHKVWNHMKTPHYK